MKTWEYITEAATSDKGMNKRDTVSFHLFNPKGVVAKLPAHDEFSIGDTYLFGASLMYSKGDNYDVKVLQNGKRLTKWDITYHVGQIEETAVKAQAFLAKKRAEAATV